MNLPTACMYLIGAPIATMALSQCTPALAVSTKPIIVEITLSAKPITTQSLSRYAAQARKSNGPNFGESGKDGRTARTCCGFFVRDFRPCPRYGKAGGDTREGMPVTYLSGSPTPSVLPPYLAKGGRTSTQDRSLTHGI